MTEENKFGIFFLFHSLRLHVASNARVKLNWACDAINLHLELRITNGSEREAANDYWFCHQLLTHANKSFAMGSPFESHLTANRSLIAVTFLVQSFESQNWENSLSIKHSKFKSNLIVFSEAVNKLSRSVLKWWSVVRISAKRRRARSRNQRQQRPFSHRICAAFRQPQRDI